MLTANIITLYLFYYMSILLIIFTSNINEDSINAITLESSLIINNLICYFINIKIQQKLKFLDNAFILKVFLYLTSVSVLHILITVFFNYMHYTIAQIYIDIIMTMITLYNNILSCIFVYCSCIEKIIKAENFYDLTQLNKIKIIQDSKLEDRCLICFENDIQDIVILNCGHIFHKDCFIIWINTRLNCPICRNKLD